MIDLSLGMEEIIKLDRGVNIYRPIYGDSLCRMDVDIAYKWHALYQIFKEGT